MTQKARKKRVTDDMLRPLKPYQGWSDEALKAEAARLNADLDSPEGETEEEFVERFLPRVGIDRMAAEVLLRVAYRDIRIHQEAAKRGSTTTARDATTSIIRAMDALKLTTAGKTDPAKLGMARGLASSEARSAFLTRAWILLRTEEALAVEASRPPEGEAPGPEEAEENARLLREAREEVARVEREEYPAIFRRSMQEACALLGVDFASVPPDWLQPALAFQHLGESSPPASLVTEPSDNPMPDE